MEAAMALAEVVVAAVVAVAGKAAQEVARA